MHPFVEKNPQGAVMKSFPILCLLFVLAAAIPAQAGGIYANEFGTRDFRASKCNMVRDISETRTKRLLWSNTGQSPARAGILALGRLMTS